MVCCLLRDDFLRRHFFIVDMVRCSSHWTMCHVCCIFQSGEDYYTTPGLSKMRRWGYVTCLCIHPTNRESGDQALQSVPWMYSSRRYTFSVVWQSPSDVSFGWHSLILLVVGLLVMSDVSTSSWASHAPVRLYVVCSNRPLSTEM